MVYIISIGDLSFAPKAASLLAFVLSLYVCGCMRAFCLEFASTIPSRRIEAPFSIGRVIGTAPCRDALFMLLSVNALVFYIILFMRIVRFTAACPGSFPVVFGPLATSFGVTLFVGFVSCVSDFGYFLFIGSAVSALTFLFLLLMRAYIFGLAYFAPKLKPILFPHTTREILSRSGLRLFALGALFGWSGIWGMIGVHQKSLSGVKPRDDSTHRRGNSFSRLIVPQVYFL
jgi:hypothetical protein